VSWEAFLILSRAKLAWANDGIKKESAFVSEW
jgi:hypothetical protein